MSERPEHLAAYDVCFDSDRVDRQEVTLNRDGEEGLRYTVELIGPVDERWRKSFRTVQLNETGFYRYRLDESGNSIRFVCRRSEGLGELLARLKSFLTLVNEEASSAH